MNHIQDCYVLQNNVKIPCVAFGTWMIKEDAKNIINNAIQLGFRHIDTAQGYNNEEGVGDAVIMSGVAREELFITTKLWNMNQGYENCKRTFEESLRKLKMSYVDLFLIHWPIPAAFRDDWQNTMHQTWRAFEELYEEGKIKAIGVSNFMQKHLEVLMKEANIFPMINQIEFHPNANQEETVAFCREKNILVEAWSPMARGSVFQSKELIRLAEKYNKSIPQICLRWTLQKGVLPITKTVTPERMKENRNLFDFEISPEDMKKIDNIKDCEDVRHDPDHIDF